MMSVWASATCLLSLALVGCGRYLSLGTPPDADAGPEARPDELGVPAGGEDGGTEGGPGAPSAEAGALESFVDHFDRISDAGLGNGWVEKVGSFTIDANGARAIVPPMALRPAEELALDVEVTAIFRYGNAQEEPEIYARLGPGAVEPSDVAYDGYALNVRSDRLEIWNCTVPQQRLTYSSIPSTRQLGTDYRIVLRVTGATTPAIAGSFYDPSGTVIGSVQVSDTTVEKITLPGIAGFGQNPASGGSWREFGWSRID
jgi:hypothetical protein